MAREPVLFHFVLREGIRARVFVNDLPLCKGMQIGPDSAGGGVSELLVPGVNEVRIEILRASTKPKSLELTLYTVLDPDTRPPTVEPLVRCVFPELWDVLPPTDRRLPYHHVARFTPTTDVHRPVWLDAPVASFGCDGTPELRQAVIRLHAALAAGDGPAFADLIALQFEEMARAYEGHAGRSVSEQREVFLDFFGHPLQVEPLDVAALHFEPLASGRIALVRRSDDRPVLEASAIDDPVPRFRGNFLLLTRHAGEWRSF